VLDTRQYRSDQVCTESSTDCRQALDPTRTMLGGEQERWLFDNLADARATWTVIGEQVVFARHNFIRANPTAQWNMDKWDGYPMSQRRLVDRLVDTRASNPVVLSGDVHAHFASELTRDPGRPDSPRVGVELTNTSISSGGDGNDVRPSWELARDDNPHVKFHTDRRGYIAVTMTPKIMRADFRIVDRVSVPDSPLRTAATGIVEAGHPALTF
jgi:alkaline phosphatase D